MTVVLLFRRPAIAKADSLTTTTVSTKRQVILPKSVRDSRHWSAGTKPLVEETGDGVLLRKIPDFAPTRYEDVFGMLTDDGEPKTIEEMNEAVLDEARRRFARD